MLHFFYSTGLPHQMIGNLDEDIQFPVRIVIAAFHIGNRAFVFFPLDCDAEDRELTSSHGLVDHIETTSPSLSSRRVISKLHCSALLMESTWSPYTVMSLHRRTVIAQPTVFHGVTDSYFAEHGKVCDFIHSLTRQAVWGMEKLRANSHQRKFVVVVHSHANRKDTVVGTIRFWYCPGSL